MLWDMAKPEGGGLYVADPKNGWSVHCTGRAVDVTLVDADGNEVPMPTAFDDFSEAAHYRYKGNNPVVAANVRRLQRAMTQAGFVMLITEWWHFNDRSTEESGFERKPILAKDIGLPLP